MHFAQRFETEPSGHVLRTMYQTLYQHAVDAVKQYIATHPGNTNSLKLHPTTDGSSAISYNLAMTLSGMAVLPRRAEGGVLRDGTGEEVGFVALNGTTLGGTLMVKRNEEWDLLREREGMLDGVLGDIGVPWVEKGETERARV